MVEYDKGTLVEISKLLGEVVERLDLIEDLMKDDDYNKRYGYPKFVSQAKNYRDEYKSKLGGLLLKEALEEMGKQ